MWPLEKKGLGTSDLYFLTRKIQWKSLSIVTLFSDQLRLAPSHTVLPSHPACEIVHFV